MDPRVLEALRASIESWQHTADGHYEDFHGAEHCPLCRLFPGDEDKPCGECPIDKATKGDGCSGTPYYVWCDAYEDWGAGGGSAEEILSAAKAEVAFLQSLLPKSE